MGKMGRPEEDDAEPLYAIAEIVYKNPEMNLTSVIRSVMQGMTHFHSEEAFIKRLRRKFNQNREFLMEQIRSRKEPAVIYLPLKRAYYGVDLYMLGLSDAATGLSELGIGVQTQVKRLVTQIDPIRSQLEMASQFDVLGVQQAAEVASRIHSGAIAETARLASLVNVSAVTQAAQLTSQIDLYGVSTATGMISEINRMQARFARPETATELMAEEMNRYHS